MLTRRRLCSLAAASLAANAPLLRAASPNGYQLVARQDRDRILRQANEWVHEKPDTLTSHPSPKSPGNLHDFFSEADYFWPNPANPTGPYKEIDGKSNPDNFLDHRKAMIRLSRYVPALTAAYRLTHKRAYAQAAADHLRAWFVTPETRMAPNLQYSQGFHGGPTGRSYGVIDTLHLVEVGRAATFLQPVMSPQDYAGVQQWFREYLIWMNTSKFGTTERDSANNHSTCWALQAAEFARLAGDEATRTAVRDRWVNKQLPDQMAVNGGFPRELARTKPYGYSIFNFDVAAALSQSLDLVRFQLADGRGACKAAEFLAPYLEDKSKWPYTHDVQHWESWPVRSPGLLFCGLACGREDWIAAWRKLDPDPTDPEVIRNYPIRQPLLWV